MCWRSKTRYLITSKKTLGMVVTGLSSFAHLACFSCIFEHIMHHICIDTILWNISCIKILKTCQVCCYLPDSSYHRQSIMIGKIKKTFMYLLVTTLNFPAPKAVINLVKCNCQKGYTWNCNCKKNEATCTEMCRCMEYVCQNNESLEILQTSTKNESDDEENTWCDLPK